MAETTVLVFFSVDRIFVITKLDSRRTQWCVHNKLY